MDWTKKQSRLFAAIGAYKLLYGRKQISKDELAAVLDATGDICKDLAARLRS